MSKVRQDLTGRLLQTAVVANKDDRRVDTNADAHRFPPRRAFVVQLSAAEDSSKPTRGRVEHVVSGRSVRFESLEALAEFFGAVLASEPAGRDEEG
jgi:hypothetical protein